RCKLPGQIVVDFLGLQADLQNSVLCEGTDQAEKSARLQHHQVWQHRAASLFGVSVIAAYLAELTSVPVSRSPWRPLSQQSTPNTGSIMLTRRRFVATGVAFPMLCFGRSALADDYPSRPITLIVPQAPGGGNDTIARIIAQKMTQSLDQQVIVENRPGAGGTLGTRQLAKSPADGY